MNLLRTAKDFSLDLDVSVDRGRSHVTAFVLPDEHGCVAVITGPRSGQYYDPAQTSAVAASVEMLDLFLSDKSAPKPRFYETGVLGYVPRLPWLDRLSVSHDGVISRRPVPDFVAGDLLDRVMRTAHQACGFDPSRDLLRSLDRMRDSGVVAVPTQEQ